MENNIIQLFYEAWENNAEYKKNSALENEVYEEYTGEIKNVIDEQTYLKISDSICTLACEAESAGFESGLRYGAMLMSWILKEGVMA